MCCFSRPVKFVGATRIFARAGDAGRQYLAYAMDVTIESELAMVLPLPVPAAPPDDAVQFIDLEGHASFFDDLALAFPPDYSPAPQPKSRHAVAANEKPKLIVHDVGRFEASFVPTIADFARLDARFRMPEGIWERLPAYADYGFAVFRLKPVHTGLFSKVAPQRVHPMALSFPRRDETALFFPTVHVHDGTVPAKARFDHMLYCQTEGVLDATLDWTRSNDVLGKFVPLESALLDGRRHGRRASLFGELENRDIVLRTPEGVTMADLSGEGDAYAYRVRATAAHAFVQYDAMRTAWHYNARTKLPALCQSLREGLATLTSARRDAWSLTTLSNDLPAHFMNGNQLWTGTSYTDGRPATDGGPGRVAMRVFTERVEPQDITLAFARLPEQRALDAIRAELATLLDRAVS